MEDWKKRLKESMDLQRKVMEMSDNEMADFLHQEAVRLSKKEKDKPRAYKFMEASLRLRKSIQGVHVVRKN